MIVTPRTKGASNMLVHLDGQEVSNHCTAVCVDEGWVEVYVLDENGHPLVVGDAIKQERRYGRVTLSTRKLLPNPQGEAKAPTTRPPEDGR